MSDEDKLSTANDTCGDERKCAIWKGMYVGNVLDLAFGKFHF